MARISKPGKAQNGAKRNLGYLVPVPGTQKKLTDKQKDSIIKSWGITPKKISKAQAGKKVRLKEDSRDYITKIKTDPKGPEGNVASIKVRRTLKGLLTGAPRSKKIMKNGGNMKIAQSGEKLKRSRTYALNAMSAGSPRIMRADYSVDTAGYAAGKKRFPATVTRTDVKRPSRTSTSEETISRGNVKRLLKKQRNGGKTPAWQRSEGKDPKGGLNKKGVASYRRANPGSKLQTAVTTKPSKLKPGSKAANRRKSFCARMSGMKKRLTSAKTANDPNSRINKSLRKWNC